jgi:hypothetical protein
MAHREPSHFIVDAPVEVLQEAVDRFDEHFGEYSVQDLDGYSLSYNDDTSESAVTLYYASDEAISVRDLLWAFLTGWFGGRGATFRFE